MANITVEANQCDVCGHIWLPTGKTAVQCAKCRTRKWNMGAAVPVQSGRAARVPSDGAALSRAKQAVPANIERTVEYEE